MYAFTSEPYRMHALVYSSAVRPWTLHHLFKYTVLLKMC